MTKLYGLDAFWAQVRRSEGCWLWTGTKTTDGYGALCIKGLPKRAHRATWFLANGPIPDGMCVCHSCDTPACVRPDHLFLGTNRDNVMDRHAKDRDGHTMGRFGETNSMHKLTSEDVRAIYARVHAGELQDALAREYRVAQTTISKIKRRVRWQEVLCG